MKKVIPEPRFAMNDFVYLDEIAEKIDRYAEELSAPRDRRWKQHCLTAIRKLVALYEGHIGRKVFRKF